MLFLGIDDVTINVWITFLTRNHRLPLPGAIPQYCARYVDPALGFAAGWNNWYVHHQSTYPMAKDIQVSILHHALR
jgi:hypothetical protein